MKIEVMTPKQVSPDFGEYTLFNVSDCVDGEYRQTRSISRSGTVTSSYTPLNMLTDPNVHTSRQSIAQNLVGVATDLFTPTKICS